MIGDTERDVLAGRAAGMRTCGVTWGVLGADGLSPHAPDFLVDRFAESVAADRRLIRRSARARRR